MIYGNAVGGMGIERSYILQDESGNEIPAVFLDNDTVFDASPNDIREGMVAATDSGVTIGTKQIPAYHTTEGFVGVPVGGECKIKINEKDRYNFTKLQAIICPFNETIAQSVASEKVAIDGKVHPVNSTEVIAAVTVDHSDKSINLGITNNGTQPLVIRYFTYKEEP